MKSKYFVTTALAAIGALGMGTNAAARTDAQIESSFRESFNFRHYLKHDRIKIESKEGVVTLTGSVDEEYHKTLAADTAAAQDGVASVDDRLQVEAAGPAAGSDAWLTAKVKTTLLFHRSVSAAATTVKSKDGLVTLGGRARNQAEKDLAAEYARDVDGVKDVRNDMTVAKGPSGAHRIEETVDDASITAEVKAALFFHRSTSALHTGVTTVNGEVTLSGKAGSAAEKDLAEKIAGDIKGVKSVKNDVAVQ